MREVLYQTPRGIRVSRVTTKLPFAKGLGRFRRDLDRHRGIYLSSGYEYPGRYSRWDIVAVRPPVELISFQREVTFRPLNDRGIAINRMLATVLRDHPHWAEFREDGGTLYGVLKPMPALFPEEERSKQPSVFSILRALTQEFRNEADDKLAFAGAFGYDLLFQFEPIPLRLPRETRKDLQLFLFDDIIYMDRKREQIERFTWDFDLASPEGELSTRGLQRTGDAVVRAPKRAAGAITADHTPAEYMANVETVREGMRQGDFYEVVLRQTFSTPYSGKASDLFEVDAARQPQPLRISHPVWRASNWWERRLRCLCGWKAIWWKPAPLPGTARRTGDPLQDEKNIRALLNSTKEESELTMCTDVDRNDKSRVCQPGTVQVIGRRLIESYAASVISDGPLKVSFS